MDCDHQQVLDYIRDTCNAIVVASSPDYTRGYRQAMRDVRSVLDYIEAHGMRDLVSTANDED